MSVETTNSLRISRTIRADRQSVWDAWTRPEHVKRWSCPVPGGVRAFETDFRVGGAYMLAMEVEGKPHTAIGQYREIEAPRRLVYTWDWKEQSIGETLVTVEFEERDGATEVTLTHEGFPTAEARDNHDQGWMGCVQNLETLFA
jgi:uncharacterized protein YndB with AHSA1/START domain